MIKLLRAGFFRLKKEAIFWIFIIASIAYAIFSLNQLYVSSLYFEELLDKTIYKYDVLIGVIIAIFISVFVGKEHSEGIIRNKIIARI